MAHCELRQSPHGIVNSVAVTCLKKLTSQMSVGKNVCKTTPATPGLLIISADVKLVLLFVVHLKFIQC